MFNVDVVTEMLAPLKEAWCYEELVSRIPKSLPQHVRTAAQVEAEETLPTLGTMVDTVYHVIQTNQGATTGYDAWIFTLEDDSVVTHLLKPYDASDEVGVSCMKFDTISIPENTVSAIHVETGSIDIFEYLEGINLRHYTRLKHRHEMV